MTSLNLLNLLVEEFLLRVANYTKRAHFKFQLKFHLLSFTGVTDLNFDFHIARITMNECRTCE